MINLIISDKKQESGDKEYTLKDIKELEKFKNETALSIYIGECKKIEELDIIYNTFRIIDGLRIFYLGETKDYHLLVHFHTKGFEAPSYQKLSKMNFEKITSKKVSKTRSLSFVNYPFVSKDLKFLKNFINLRKLSLMIFGDKDENPIDLSTLGEIDIMTYEGISFLNIDFRFFPSKGSISIKSLKNSKHIWRLSLLSNFYHSLVDLDVLASMDKLKFLLIIGWQKIDSLESLLNSSSLEAIYLDLNLYNQVDKSLMDKFKKKKIKIQPTDITKEKIFGYMGFG